MFSAEIKKPTNIPNRPRIMKYKAYTIVVMNRDSLVGPDTWIILIR